MNFVDKNSVDKFSQKLVTVIHIENPSLFFCRFEDENYRYEELNYLIRQQTKQKTNWEYVVHNDAGRLFYSTIHGQWCRGRLILLKLGHNKPACAKVFLIDYGSTEFIPFTSKFIARSTKEIDNFNDGKGLCFACSLFNVKPFYDSSIQNQCLQKDWTSYANYLFKKETINNKYYLVPYSESSEFFGEKIICDLLPEEMSNNTTISHFLVKSKVAQFT